VSDTIDRDHLARLWVSPGCTIRSIARRLHVSEERLKRTATALGLGERPAMRKTAAPRAPRTTKARDKYGPLPGDPTPDQMNELLAYCLARRLMSGHDLPHGILCRAGGCPPPDDE